MSVASLAPLAVALPMLGAALAFVLIRHPRAQRRVSLAILALTLALEVLVLAVVWTSGPVAVHLGGWAPPFGIVMVADQFSSLLLVVSSAVSLSAGIGIETEIADIPRLAWFAQWNPLSINWNLPNEGPSATGFTFLGSLMNVMVGFHYYL